MCVFQHLLTTPTHPSSHIVLRSLPRRSRSRSHHCFLIFLCVCVFSLKTNKQKKKNLSLKTVIVVCCCFGAVRFLFFLCPLFFISFSVLISSPPRHNKKTTVFSRFGRSSLFEIICFLLFWSACNFVTPSQTHTHASHKTLTT